MNENHGPMSSLPPPPGAVPSGVSPVDSSTIPTAGVGGVGGVGGAAGSDRPKWVGRGLAIVVALALFAGGTALAINAGNAQSGADTPEGAMHGVLEALSNEDLLAAAVYVEPAERETLVEAGFDIAAELVRLEVFSDAFDLSAIEGVDFTFTDVEIEAVEVRPGLAHLFMRGGTASVAVDGQAIPFGPLVTDRVESHELAVVEETSSEIEPSEEPVVVVQRDGRWFISLWYTVAENARLAVDASLPDPGQRPLAIGAADPAGVVESLFEATVELDLPLLVGLIDPEEAAALYDYAPLFLPDATEAVAGAIDQVRADGWSWSAVPTDLETVPIEDGLAEVHLRRMEFELHGPGVDASAVLGEDEIVVDAVLYDIDFHLEFVDDCFDLTIDDGFSVEAERFCSDEVTDQVDLGEFGRSLEALVADAPGEMGLVVSEVDGRWYFSPLRTGSRATLAQLQAVDPDALADFIDALIEVANDPSVLLGPMFDAGFGQGFSFDS